MKTTTSRLLTQPAPAILTALLAGMLASMTWLRNGQEVTPSLLALSTGLVVTGILANQYPIHVRLSTKLYMGSVVLFLMATMLPVPLAALAAFLGLGIGEIWARPHTDMSWSSIVTQVSRLVLVVLLASLVAHLTPVHSSLHSILLVCTGAILWAGDMLTLPLLLVPMTGERPRTILLDGMRVAGQTEAAQYLVGLLGTLAAQQVPWAICLIVLPTALVYRTSKRAKEMHDGTRQLLEGMADTVDLRDPYTGGHSRRVTEYTAAILQELGKSGPEVSLILAAARVHDIGKIGIPDDILNKTGKLTAEEWAIMTTHPEQGAALLQRYPDFARGVEIVRHHHESWNGSGYPQGLQHDAIPFGARVIAVADSYDAMTSDRPYRAGMSSERAISILRDGRGSQWDPHIVDACVRALAASVSQPPTSHLKIVSPTAARSATATA